MLSRTRLLVSSVQTSYRSGSLTVGSFRAFSNEGKKSIPNVVINKQPATGASKTSTPATNSKCDDPKAASKEDDEEDLEEMFIQGPSGLEWGGPTRGGRRPEPTRYGDWERKGRATDFR
jgi:hypothetical protein